MLRLLKLRATECLGPPDTDPEIAMVASDMLRHGCGRRTQSRRDQAAPRPWPCFPSPRWPRGIANHAFDDGRMKGHAPT